jgi:hypothetical protein
MQPPGRNGPRRLLDSGHTRSHERGIQTANATVRLAIIGDAEKFTRIAALTCQRHRQNRGHKPPLKRGAGVLPLLPARWASPAGRIKVSGAILCALTRLRIEL